MMTPFRRFGYDHGLDTLTLLVVLTATVVACAFYVGHVIDKAMQQLIIYNANDTQLLLGLQKVHADSSSATNARLDALRDRLKIMEEKQEINNFKTDMIRGSNSNSKVQPQKWDTKKTPGRQPN
jgi:hypothetical protein